MPRSKLKPAACHPDRLTRYAELCEPCYRRKFRAEHSEELRARTQKWRAANPDRLRARERERTLAAYGLTVESYETLLAAQDGRCAICRTTEPGAPGRSWQVDHDHSCCPEARRSCGKCVRGLLCASCNIGLGWAERAEWIAAAQEYLTSHPSPVLSWQPAVPPAG